MNTSSFRSLKTVLFIPADKPKYLESAIKHRPNAVQLDLEDSVAPEQKQNARAQLADACAQLADNNITTVVRINNDDTNSAKDVRAALAAGVDAITIPKLESCAQVEQVASLITDLESEYKLTRNSVKILGLIETITGLLNRADWRDASERLTGLALGTEDLCLEMACEPSFDNLIDPCRRLLYSAREAGLAAWGFPASIANFSELSELEHAFKQAKSMGMDGVWCIHPKQLELAKKVFTITQTERDNARAIVQIFEQALAQGNAAVKLNDQMIDLPVYKRAKNLLD